MRKTELKQKELLEQMTLREKAAFLSGKNEWQSRDIPRLKIPSITFSDGPNGLRRQAGTGDHLGLNPSLEATCFPTAATIANSWDEALGEAVGKALGEEAVAQDVQVLLGPGLNIKRSPLCGRNFEYFSEDPYLAGKMAAAYVRGIQSQGVAACPKHFAVNSQELRRMSMDAVVDERTLREIYLTGFEIAIKEGNAKCLMTSYNRINGEYANENQHLLKDILRDEWKYDGMIVTDWGGSNDPVCAVKAQSDLEMPTPGFDSARQLLRAIEKGELTEEDLDVCVSDLLNAVQTLSDNRKKAQIAWEEHHQLARKAAEESIVLLKNEGKDNALLPLKVGCKVALIGDFADTPRYQGAGSSKVRTKEAVASMKSLIEKYPVTFVGYEQGYKRSGEEDEALVAEAIELARKADVVLYCFGLNEISETEGLDRSHMRIPRNQINVLERITAIQPNIVGILSGGSAIEMPWQHCCKSLIHGYLGGQAGAEAMLNVVTGRINPSGHLAETYPVYYEDTPACSYYPSKERTSEYREGLYVGYRYYDTARIAVNYPFGYGLSYTTFAYSDLQIMENGIRFMIENTGAYDGAEVVQLYVGLPKAMVFRPKKELKGFQKVWLKAGEKKNVQISFDDKTFRYWNVRTSKWEIEGGNYCIMVGSNVEDIRLQGSIFIQESTNLLPYGAVQLLRYRTGHIQNVSDDEFEKLLGHPIPDGSWKGELERNDTVSQLYYAKSRLARLVHQIIKKQIQKNEQAGKTDLNLLFQYNITFRAIAKMTGGMVSMKMVDGMLLVVNGHFLKGMGQIIKGFFQNRSENKDYETKMKIKNT